MGESKSEQARGTEQGPPGLFGRRTVGPETETGKNKATATGLEVTDKGSGTVTEQNSTYQDWENSPSAFQLQRSRIHSARYMVPDSVSSPRIKECPLDPSRKSGVLNPQREKARKSQISGYHNKPIWELLSYVIFPQIAHFILIFPTEAIFF